MGDHRKRAIIKSSVREVDIDIEGKVFYVIPPPNGTRFDMVWRAMGYEAVSGPFKISDKRFVLR